MALVLSAVKCLAMLRAAQRHRQADNGGDDASDKHPDRFVSRGSSKESGNVGPERVRGLNTKDDENHTANHQSQRNDFIHNVLSMSFCVLQSTRHTRLRPEMKLTSTMTMAITSRT